jgi:hypothetical protein
MTKSEINLLENMLNVLEKSIVEKGLPKSHLHNIKDLRSKTLSIFVNEFKKSVQEKP